MCTEKYREIFVERVWTKESWKKKQKEAVGGVILDRNSW